MKKYQKALSNKKLEFQIERVLLKKEIKAQLNDVYSFFHPVIIPYTDQILDP